MRLDLGKPVELHDVLAGGLRDRLWISLRDSLGERRCRCARAVLHASIRDSIDTSFLGDRFKGHP